ncbi:hypothetical protein BJV74DRAFT_798917 [Russula compacta]|nr:hypothetical protein BJV74DRAFT_798917 [Russula compacta]
MADGWDWAEPQGDANGRTRKGSSTPGSAHAEHRHLSYPYPYSQGGSLPGKLWTNESAINASVGHPNSIVCPQAAHHWGLIISFNGNLMKPEPHQVGGLGHTPTRWVLFVISASSHASPLPSASALIRGPHPSSTFPLALNPAFSSHLPELSHLRPPGLQTTYLCLLVQKALHNFLMSTIVSAACRSKRKRPSGKKNWREADADLSAYKLHAGERQHGSGPRIEHKIIELTKTLPLVAGSKGPMIVVRARDVCSRLILVPNVQQSHRISDERCVLACARRVERKPSGPVVSGADKWG